MTTQEDVTRFYDRLVFPSKSSHKEYERLVPGSLKGKWVGDFGCGQSLFKDVFERTKCKAIFLDISWNVVNKIESPFRVQASLTNVPLKNESIDAIYCIGVVHHIPEMEKSITEMMRVLRMNGTIVLGVYAEKSVQASLRKVYDLNTLTISRKLLEFTAGLLIWLKNNKNGLRFRSDDHRKRIEDLLKTPLVRYWNIEWYIHFLQQLGGKVVAENRISSMNILVVQKVKSSG